MQDSSQFEKSVWRIISAFLIFCWIINVVYNYSIGTLHHVLIPSIISTFICIRLIVNPTEFGLFGILSSFWGWLYVWSTGSVIGILLFILGLGFFYKIGFFKKFWIPKLIFFVLCFSYAIYHVYTINSRIVIDTMLDSIVVVLVVIMAALLFHDDVRQRYKLVTSSTGLSTIFSEQEITYIKFLIQDYKYLSIAQNLNVSESSVKRIFSKMYTKINAKGKTEFLEKIKEIATPEELVALNIINPQEGQPSKEPI